MEWQDLHRIACGSSALVYLGLNECGRLTPSERRHCNVIVEEIDENEDQHEYPRGLVTSVVVDGRASCPSNVGK